MGWSNYIIIPELKLIIEVSRDVGDIEDYECDAIDKAISDDNFEHVYHVEGDDVIDIENVPIQKITIKDLAELYRRYDMIQSLTGLDYNKLLLYWMKKRDMAFSIKSEHDIDLKGYEKEGYNIVRR
jgi:hypothetical protein